MLDLRTEKEREMDAKRESILNAFKRIDNESGYQYTTWRICIAVAKERGDMTPHNVYGYLLRAGVRSYADIHRFDHN